MTLYDALMHSDARFAAFGTSHLTVLSLSLVGALALIALGRSHADAAAKTAVRTALGVSILVFEVSFVLYAIPLGNFELARSLPLQLCDMAAFAAAIALLTKNQRLSEVGFFLSLTGTLITTTGPELTYDFPHVSFFCFFGTHPFVTVSMLYLVVGLRHWPDQGAAWRVFLLGNLYIALMTVVNLGLGSNYVYLCWKPKVTSPIDWLGPWPIYVALMDAIMLGLLLLLGAIVPHRASVMPDTCDEGIAMGSVSIN